MNTIKKIALIFLGISCAALTASGQKRSIEADLRKISGPLNPSFRECVGAGRANEGLRADWQRQLRMIKQDCGFEYIRFHGLLSDDMGVYKEDFKGNPLFNWQYIDELFDFLLSIKMRPFVELGFMPDDLASGKKTVFWWKGNITPPKDYLKWNLLIKNLITHWTERYGKSEVEKWYFEVWNEPNLRNLFFTGDQDAYFTLYKETVQAIKSVDDKYRVGGPATAGNAWIPEMIRYCTQNHVQIDFISTHDYGVKQGYLDLSGHVGTIINPNKNSVADNMIRSKKQIEISAIPKLPLNYTEWSSSYTPTDPMHDTYQQAAYNLNTIKKAGSYAQAMSYWTFTDIFEEQGPRMTPFHGGFGLLNYQDIKKPAYYAYKYLNELGSQQLYNRDSSSIICSDGRNIQILFWDCTIDHPGDSTNDQVFYKKLLPPKAASNVSLKVKGLTPGKYRLEVYQTGYRHNDAYSVYYDMGSPAQLTRKQVEVLKQQSNGKPSFSSSIYIGKAGVFEKEIPMRQNDVYFIKLIRR